MEFSSFDRGSDDHHDKGEKKPSKGFEIGDFNFDPMVFEGLNGEIITIVDTGGRLSARVGDHEVGYVTYHIERQNLLEQVFQDRMRFGYINVTSQAFKGTKLSALLLFFLATKAASLGLQVIAVGHPDPSLADYWTAMGFDLHTAKQRQLHYLSTLVDEYGSRVYPNESLPSLQDVTVTEAEASTHAMMMWAQSSYRKYWKPYVPKKEKCVVQ